MTGRERSVDVLIVGAGPAGLAAAARLAAAGVERVEVLDRERQAGGVPRHCAHGGFGTWTHPLTGPVYARLLRDGAVHAGAVVRTGVTALDWAGPLTLAAVGPRGPENVTARAVVLATGARERPRAARLVPGTRPAGVYTTGELQQAVHLHGQRIGSRAVVVGAEDVSYAAAATVRAAGAQVAAMVTDQARAQTSPLRAQDARLRRGIPLLTRTTVAELLGHGRLYGVRVRAHDGRTTVLPCDTVVFTGDFVPDHELARRGQIVLDPASRAPAVDGGLHTSRPGVFAVGSVLHPVESAGTAAREGVQAAGAVLEWLVAAEWPGSVRLVVERPLHWIAPHRVTRGDDLPYVLRTTAELTAPVLYVLQNGRLLHRERVLARTVLPGRPLHLSPRWTHLVDPRGGEVRIRVG
ncbi:NAD(P)/FAD-dependent oxidoreductase [Streptomyces mangrovisoli]|uniref:Oxidoreductase n=1 Tax=Streptomyces mangrovisoli TaxID=1428628 RepID=A0A1J4NLK3_9ACTN|nr:FAD-dependent oxidoreductase [Streptomyces mangrovisoli]OIJ63281.1 oxidoreductase [Streptomyces mangrovisoli]